MSSISDALREIPTADQLKSEHQITLIDRARSARDDADRHDSEPSTGTATPSADQNLRKRLTHQSSNFQETIRREINRQKYSRYTQQRYQLNDADRTLSQTRSATSMSQNGEEASAAQRNYLGRAQSKAKAFLNRKRNLGRGKDERDTVVDVLYENQRGAFFFGVPRYSSNSLLPTDPKPWQNADFRTSPVDIRNAQVPDPSWEWVWKSWYVDMSRDVDEEGWEYSFAFVGHGGSAFAWHGNHPWFHSFVRRRRWIRMRRRRVVKHVTRERAHELNADYFTIHTKNVRTPSLADSRAPSVSTGNIFARFTEPEMAVEEMEIPNIADLFLALRRAKVDREKISAVRKFIDQGGDEIVYLSERMEEIMSMFVFQSSRKDLLDSLITRHDETHKKQNDLATHNHDEDDDAKRNNHDKQVRQAENLLEAVHAAEQHVLKLEYWSDVKGVSDPTPASHTENGHNEPSFKNKQAASDGAPKLHRHAEHNPDENQQSRAPVKSTWASKPQRADTTSTTASSANSAFFDAESDISDTTEKAGGGEAGSPPPSRGKAASTEASPDADDDHDSDADENLYATAAESAAEIDGKGDEWKVKGKTSEIPNLDGVPEDEPIPETHGHSSIISGDVLEELVPESEKD